MSNVILEKSDLIATIRLNRPEAMNAVNQELLEELSKATADVEKDEDIRVVVITGEGKAFCAGADLKTLHMLKGKDTASFLRNLDVWIRTFQRVYQEIENCSKPVIAAVNGIAFAGGFELLQVCDIVICSDRAILGDQHTNFGLIPGGGGSQRLPRLISPRKAKEYILTGDIIPLSDAERLGLINKVVPAKKLAEEVMSLARRLATKSPLAARHVKHLVNHGLNMDLTDGMDMERLVMLEYFVSNDMAEGVKAFVEKRRPEFTGT